MSSLDQRPPLRPPLPPLSLYIHIPWCVRKCPYCDFNSHQSDSIPEQDYVASLLEDLNQDLGFVQGRKLASIFIGGGTPSLFSEKGIETLVKGVADKLDFEDSIEITLEANPGTAEAQRFRGYCDAGINRLSIGAQSFHDLQLQELGRIHSRDQAVAAIELAQQVGFDNINIDLMHGLPKQDTQSALSDIQQALDLDVSHISWYQLTIEPNTEFYNKPPLLPDEDRLDDIQQAGLSLLESHGFRQYEVSAYTKDKLHSKHNLNYWQFGDYLGIGAGAHSKVSSFNADSETLEISRYWKRRQPNQYLECQNQFVAGSRILDRRDIVGEFMMNSLRLNAGFSFQNFETTTGLSRSTIGASLKKLREKELLDIGEKGAAVTTLGQRFLDTVLGEFFAD